MELHRKYKAVNRQDLISYSYSTKVWAEQMLPYIHTILGVDPTGTNVTSQAAASHVFQLQHACHIRELAHLSTVLLPAQAISH